MSLISVHPKLEQFREIHKLMVDQLNEFTLQACRFSDFFAYCRKEVLPFLDLEEEVLFSTLFKKAETRAGGPLCMLYYDLHLSIPPLDRSANICDLPRVNPLKMQHSVLRRPFYDANSPVCIPIEDHIACDQILSQAETLLMVDVSTESARVLSNLASVFLSILKSSFEKKDNCLLPMAQQLLTEEELSKLPQIKN